MQDLENLIRILSNNKIDIGTRYRVNDDHYFVFLIDTKEGSPYLVFNNFQNKIGSFKFFGSGKLKTEVNQLSNLIKNLGNFTIDENYYKYRISQLEEELSNIQKILKATK